MKSSCSFSSFNMCYSRVNDQTHVIISKSILPFHRCCIIWGKSIRFSILPCHLLVAVVIIPSCMQRWPCRIAIKSHAHEPLHNELKIHDAQKNCLPLMLKQIRVRRRQRSVTVNEARDKTWSKRPSQNTFFFKQPTRTLRGENCMHRFRNRLLIS